MPPFFSPFEDVNEGKKRLTGIQDHTDVTVKAGDEGTSRINNPSKMNDNEKA